MRDKQYCPVIGRWLISISSQIFLKYLLHLTPGSMENDTPLVLTNVQHFADISAGTSLYIA